MPVSTTVISSVSTVTELASWLTTINESFQRIYDISILLNTVESDQNDIKTQIDTLITDSASKSYITSIVGLLEDLSTTDQTSIVASINEVLTDLTDHINDVANPHAVTADQVGLGNVDNTTDLDKPISTATQAALDNKLDLDGITEGSNITITYDGSGNPTISATGDLGASVDAVDVIVSSGWGGLSTNAQSSFAELYTSLDTHTLNTSNPHAVTAEQVGLGNVPNVDATDRTNHTGTQTSSTISDFETTVDSIISGASAEELSDIDSVGSGSIITDVERTKLSGIESGADITDSANVQSAGAAMTANNLSDIANASVARDNLGVTIGSDVQAHSAILDGTTASFTTAKDTKLLGIEANADVTDTENVTAAGALMDTEVDPNLKSFVLPDNTTISTFTKTLLDDTSDLAVRATIGVYSTGEVDTGLASKLDKNLILYAVQSLLTSTDSYDVGDIITVGTSIQYEVVSTGEHVTTAGGIKLKILPDGNIYHLEAWGPDDTASLRAAILDIVDIVDAETWLNNTPPTPNKCVMKFSSHFGLDTQLDIGNAAMAPASVGFDIDFRNASFVATGTWAATTPMIRIKHSDANIWLPWVDSDFKASCVYITGCWNSRIYGNRTFRWGYDDEAYGLKLDAPMGGSVLYGAYSRQFVTTSDPNETDDAYWLGRALWVNAYDFEIEGFHGGRTGTPIYIESGDNVTFTNCHPYNGRASNPRTDPNLIVNAAGNNGKMIKFVDCYLDNGLIHDYGDSLHFYDCHLLEYSPAVTLTQPHVRSYCYDGRDGTAPNAVVNNCKNMSFGLFDSPDTLHSWGGDSTALQNLYDEMDALGSMVRIGKRDVIHYNRLDDVAYDTRTRLGGKFVQSLKSGNSAEFKSRIDPATGDFSFELGGTTLFGNASGSATGSLVQSSATDATSGKLLTVGAGGLLQTNSGYGPEIPDVDAFDTPEGSYITNPTTTNAASLPYGAVYGKILVRHFGNNNLEQTAWKNADGIKWQRVAIAGVWQDWKMVYSQDNIVGTVSEDGSGNPTGSVVEQGSNANGEYVRFADGTQMCWHKLTSSDSTFVIWTYPISFASVANVQLTPQGVDPRVSTPNADGNVNQIAVNCWDLTGTRVINDVNCYAIGRWF